MTSPTDIPRMVGMAWAGVALAAILTLTPARAAEDFRYGPETVDIAAHWAARANLANAVMFSGLGEPLLISMSTADDILKHAGYVARPPMPDMAVVGGVYTAGEPALTQAPDFTDLSTLRWDPESFDRTLEPAAQAWALIKITSPEFHLNFHDDKADRRVALMMLPQARAQAQVLEQKLLTSDGLFAPLRPDGTFAEASPENQAVVLWGVANLILAATSTRDDYWHKAYRDLIDADEYGDLADRAFLAVAQLPPEAPADRALAIEALGRFALATNDTGRRAEALESARSHADRLADIQGGAVDDLGLAIYGLVEASRLLGDDRYGKAAADLFETALLPQWDDQLGVFGGSDQIAYTPATTAAVAAAFNAMRWHGPSKLAQQAEQFYPRFFETVVARAGLLQSSPLPLVPAQYREDRPDAAFAHPALPAPAEVGVAPVFAAEVVHENDTWRVSDPTFRTAEAMFLTNMLVMPREGQADAFLPQDRLSTLAR